MNGGVSNSGRALTAVSESMMSGESAEDPGSSNNSGDKRCGRHDWWRPVRSAANVPGGTA
ncbi:MAG: hypothetical protein E7047_06740 [Lentisphaerae bacterium]|nr:hypothetical protein [Lentisphaerota bacterium]